MFGVELYCSSVGCAGVLLKISCFFSVSRAWCIFCSFIFELNEYASSRVFCVMKIMTCPFSFLPVLPLLWMCRIAEGIGS